jgi:uncharacterized membrane protein
MAETQALQIKDGRRYPYLRPYLREWFRDSLTIVPILFLIGGILLFLLMRFVDIRLLGSMRLSQNPAGQIDAAISISSVIAISMLSFMGVIFSITLVALQLANQQFSPHIVRNFEGSATVKIAMGLFIATFVYALLLLREASSGGGGNNQVASLSVALLLVIASVVIFVIFVREILQMLRIGKVVSKIVNDTHHAIDKNFPRDTAYITAELPPVDDPTQIVLYLDPPSSLVIDRAPQGILKAINDVHLLRMATEMDCFFHILFHNGDHIMRGDPIVEVYGTNEELSKDILAQFVVGNERNLYQDPGFGFRQLVDIASHALATGVNLPSIAVLVIENLTELLLQIARRPAPTGYYADEAGRIRLLRPLHSWDDYVDLAFTEISHYGCDHPLVERTLVQAYDRLLAHVPQDYKPPVEEQCAKLNDILAQNA